MIDVTNWKGKNWLHKTGYSLAGLRDALRTEKAVREEAFVLVAVTVLAFFRFGFCGWTKVLKICLICIVPLIVELINTAFELMVDLCFGTDYREEIRIAKDILSAAVLLTLIVSYLYCLLILFF